MKTRIWLDWKLLILRKMQTMILFSKCVMYRYSAIHPLTSVITCMMIWPDGHLHSNPEVFSVMIRLLPLKNQILCIFDTTKIRPVTNTMFEAERISGLWVNSSFNLIEIYIKIDVCVSNQISCVAKQNVISTRNILKK